jgi:hypothetical protein
MIADRRRQWHAEPCNARRRSGRPLLGWALGEWSGAPHGALGVIDSSARPRPFTPEVAALADAIHARYRALVLVALRRAAHRGAGRATSQPRGTVQMTEIEVEVQGELHVGPPRTRASRLGWVASGRGSCSCASCGQLDERAPVRFAQLRDPEDFPGQLGLSCTGASTITGMRRFAARRS